MMFYQQHIPVAEPVHHIPDIQSVRSLCMCHISAKSRSIQYHLPAVCCRHRFMDFSHRRCDKSTVKEDIRPAYACSFYYAVINTHSFLICPYHLRTADRHQVQIPVERIFLLLCSAASKFQVSRTQTESLECAAAVPQLYDRRLRAFFKARESIVRLAQEDILRSRHVF